MYQFMKVYLKNRPKHCTTLYLHHSLGSNFLTVLRVHNTKCGKTVIRDSPKRNKLYTISILFMQLCCSFPLHSSKTQQTVYLNRMPVHHKKACLVPPASEEQTAKHFLPSCKYKEDIVDVVRHGN